MCKWNDTVRMTIPEGMCTDRINKTISVDRCIADQIKMLWEYGIETTGCCCGHGKDVPNVIVADYLKEEDISRILELLGKNDLRNWKVLQWQLRDVGESRGEE